VTLLDCKPEITEVGKWAGEGAQATGGVCQWQATLVGFANADILAPIIEKSHQKPDILNICGYPRADH